MQTGKKYSGTNKLRTGPSLYEFSVCLSLPIVSFSHEISAAQQNSDLVCRIYYISTLLIRCRRVRRHVSRVLGWIIHLYTGQSISTLLIVWHVSGATCEWRVRSEVARAKQLADTATRNIQLRCMSSCPQNTLEFLYCDIDTVMNKQYCWKHLHTFAL